MLERKSIKISSDQYVRMSRMGWHFNVCDQCGLKFVRRSHDFDCPNCPPDNKRYPFIIQASLLLVIVIFIIPVLLMDFLEFLFRRK